MKKLGIKILLLSGILLVSVWAGGRFDNIDRKHNNNPNIIRAVNANRFDSLDILFIGSSGTYSGINPSYFDSIGLHTYNLGVAAAGPYFYELLVNDYLKAASKKPKSVFILILPNTFMNGTDDFTSFGIHRYLDQPLSNAAVAQKYSGWLSYPSLLLKSFQKGVKNLLPDKKTSTAIAQQTVSGKGFYPSDEVTTHETERNEAKSNNKWRSQQFDTTRFNYLQRYIQFVQRSGVEVVLFSIPSNKLSSFFNDAYMDEYRRSVSRLAKEFIFLDLSLQPLDSTSYRNSDHLNTHGASIITREMITSIQKNQHLNNLFGLSVHQN
jgi:hypothetical protein